MGSIRLLSLALEGFKSFASRAELSFPGDLIAIVGPNGSGKSNIADAIAWVLGEQSARLLRSQNMADVIFAGAPKRAPLGAAEVRLVLAAGDGRWPDTDGRLEISRRVFRDGTSEYRIGGRRARLKDVVDRLIDAGLGTRAYAIIEQGRIGQVLSARPTERRALFEEAAGITKYRVRRHEAELKLAETRANLLRVQDVATEVRRSLEAARRQARRAEKHLELRSHLAGIRAELFAGRRAALAATLTERHGTLNTCREQESEAAARLADADARAAELSAARDGVVEALQTARDEQSQCHASAERREAEETAARHEVDEAHARRDAAAAEAARLAAMADGLRRAEIDLVAAGAAASTTLASAEQAAAAATTRHEEAEAAAHTAAALAEDARRTLLAAASAATEGRNRVHRLELELEQNGYQRTRLAGEKERLAHHLGEVTASAREATEREAAAAHASHEMSERRGSLATRHDAIAARIVELAAERERVAHERWQARHEREGAERGLAATRALPQVLARALRADQVRGIVSDYLDPDPAAARLLDRACGDLLGLPVVAGAEAATALVERAPKGEGRVMAAVADPAVPPRSSPLLEGVPVADEDRGWLSRALPRADVAASLAEALTRAAADPDLVLLVPDGTVVRGGRIELPGKTAGVAGVMELKVRERDAARSERDAATREGALAEELEAAQHDVAAIAQDLQLVDAAARDGAEALAAAGSARQALQRDRARLEREADALAGEATRLEAELTSLTVQLEAGRTDAERLAVRASGLEAEVDALAREAGRGRDAAGLAHGEVERARGIVAVARERLQATSRELERHREQLADLASRQEHARAEADSQGHRAEAAASAGVQARADLEGLLARRVAAHHEVERLTTQREELKGSLADATALAERSRAAHLAARDASHGAELALAEAQGNWERLEETIALTLGADATLPDEALPAEQTAALERDEQRLVKDLEELGPVNELAVAQRNELEARHRFLQEQKRDLERSLESLLATATELDATCAERFLATLEEANRSFDAVFRELFGGGEARAELSDPEAPLESGIELRVKPPGKHTQSALLLSGGEKALAAIALLLALFRIRPAPFCLLDEIDAPLDDANVERLCRLLRDMSGETQFLVITHNRRTMAHADVIYGVTMAEPGVSRTVSVRLEE